MFRVIDPLLYCALQKVSEENVVCMLERMGECACCVGCFVCVCVCVCVCGVACVLKRPWSEAERVAVETHLKRNIMELRVPAKADCERCLQLCPLLVTKQRDWRAIKLYCHTRIQLLKKQGRREANGAAVC